MYGNSDTRQYRLFDNSGNPVSNEITAFGPSGGAFYDVHNQILALPSGGFAIGRENDGNVALRIFSADGVGAGAISIDSRSWYDSNTSEIPVTVLSDGSFVFAFSTSEYSDVTDEVITRIELHMFDSDGTFNIRREIIFPESSISPGGTLVTTLDDGRLALIYQRTTVFGPGGLPVDSQIDIVAQLLDANLNIASSPIRARYVARSSSTVQSECRENG